MENATPSGSARVENAIVRSILVADCDAVFSSTAAKVLRGVGHRVRVLDCRDQALLGKFIEEYTDAIVELSPDGVPHMEFLRVLRARLPRGRIVVVSAYPALRVAVAAIQAGADDYLAKPLIAQDLLRVLDSGRLVQYEPTGIPSLARIQWEHISNVLTQMNGNISAAARALGVQRSTLQRKLRKYPPVR